MTAEKSRRSSIDRLLFEACDKSTGDAEKIGLIVGLGAEPNRFDGRSGMTPLMFAARSPYAEACRGLLANGASAHLRDAVGRSAIDIAVGVAKDSGNRDEILAMLWRIE